jgi:putative addiction module CopG family antidote
LPEDVARFAEAKVASGRFASVDDVLRAGVEALEAQEEGAQEWLAYAREKWNEGVLASARGEFVTGTPREIMARIQQRVAKAL